MFVYFYVYLHFIYTLLVAQTSIGDCDIPSGIPEMISMWITRNALPGLLEMRDLICYIIFALKNSNQLLLYYCLLLSPPTLSPDIFIILLTWIALPLWCEATNVARVCWWVYCGASMSPYAVSGTNDLFVWSICYITAFSDVRNVSKSKNNNNNSKSNNETNNINYYQCAFSSSMIWFVFFPYPCSVWL